MLTFRTLAVSSATFWFALVIVVIGLALPTRSFAIERLVTTYNLPRSWSTTLSCVGGVNAGSDYKHIRECTPEGYCAHFEGRVTACYFPFRPESPPSEHEVPFLSFADFAKRSSGDDFEPDYKRQRWGGDLNPTVWQGARNTTLGGLPAYVNISERHAVVNVSESERHAVLTYPIIAYTDRSGYWRNWVYWIPTKEGGIHVTAAAYGEFDGSIAMGPELVAPVINDVEAMLNSLRFDVSRTAAFPLGAPEEADGGTPWRTVTGSILAVLAAASALAGLAASARAKTPDAEQPEPDQPIGYILQLSDARLAVSDAHPAAFTVQVYRVMPDASYQPADDAAIALHLPAGLSAQPANASGTLSTAVWQTGAVAEGSAITVEATSALGSTSATVPVEVSQEYGLEFF